MDISLVYKSPSEAEGKFSSYRILLVLFLKSRAKKKKKFFCRYFKRWQNREANQSHHKGSQCRPSHLHIVHRTLLFIYESWNV